KNLDFRLHHRPKLQKMQEIHQKEWSLHFIKPFIPKQICDKENFDQKDGCLNFFSNKKSRSWELTMLLLFQD
ncbi:hypothetical protein CAI16_18825, partial [Virgibacillus dokdonensis]